jgi:hypothetical protein
MAKLKPNTKPVNTKPATLAKLPTGLLSPHQVASSSAQYLKEPADNVGSPSKKDSASSTLL